MFTTDISSNSFAGNLWSWNKKVLQTHMQTYPFQKANNVLVNIKISLIRQNGRPSGTLSQLITGSLELSSEWTLDSHPDLFFQDDGGNSGFGNLQNSSCSRPPTWFLIWYALTVKPFIGKCRLQYKAICGMSTFVHGFECISATTRISATEGPWVFCTVM